MHTPSRERVALALKELRASLGFSQTDMGIAVGVSQGQIAKWEGASQTPPGQAFAKFARLATSDTREMWLELAGLTSQEASVRVGEIVSIPLLRDSAAAGTPRAIDEREVAEMISMPKEWLPRGGSLYAVRVEGDSMSPILLDGHIVIINVASRDPVKLQQRMVVARNTATDGVTVKWLRYSGKIFSLVPQHTAPEYEIQYLHPTGDFEIVGEVVKWIGEPPPAPKGRKQ